MILSRVFGAYPILLRRAYAAYSLLESILSVMALSSLAGAFFSMLTSQFSGMIKFNPSVIAV